ncbi:helix-turn-helix domain-containing protein [Clostridium sp.]|uniref:helix-turn-helix transcriptional regulator n=1 Tax=Clostridium sp. TaxID=1506 RepID=UPI001A3EB04F|nr:helix-turn-helix domain-containing protein [Clostridium sp.]MBK5239784.1 helix-turn-helix domain-containing protein [Clostridium sp.]
MIKNKLKQILADRGIKQSWICEHTGITKATMSNIVNNRYNTSMEIGFKIAELLGLSITDIFYNDEV